MTGLGQDEIECIDRLFGTVQQINIRAAKATNVVVNTKNLLIIGTINTNTPSIVLMVQ